MGVTKGVGEEVSSGVGVTVGSGVGVINASGVGEGSKVTPGVGVIVTWGVGDGLGVVGSIFETEFCGSGSDLGRKSLLFMSVSYPLPKLASVVVIDSSVDVSFAFLSTLVFTAGLVTDEVSP